jgi:hypothetical protein
MIDSFCLNSSAEFYRKEAHNLMTAVKAELRNEDIGVRLQNEA